MRKESLAVALVLFALFSWSVMGDPEDASNIVASEGGNVTALAIGASGGGGGSDTQRWQGYFGNITAGIQLADASNNTLYQWVDGVPDGEVYAANSSNVVWENIDCVNFSTNTSVLRYNATDLNSFIGLGENEQASSDSVNATFNQTFGDDGDSFTVGTTTIDNAENCSMVTLFNGSGYQTEQWKEVLLTDNVSIVFASIIYQDTNGFNNETMDFEMIVGVNTTGPRNYYFFTEIS